MPVLVHEELGEVLLVERLLCLAGREDVCSVHGEGALSGHGAVVQGLAVDVREAVVERLGRLVGQRDGAELGEGGRLELLLQHLPGLLLLLALRQGGLVVQGPLHLGEGDGSLGE